LGSYHISKTGEAKYFKFDIQTDRGEHDRFSPEGYMFRVT